MEWIDLPQDRDRWRVMNFRVSLNAGISSLAENRLASQEGLCSREYLFIYGLLNSAIRSYTRGGMNRN
jgi:hypothetical protein